MSVRSVAQGSARVLPLIIAASLHARSARAYDAEVTAETAAQSYDVRSPTGDPVVARRRFTQTIGLGVYRLAAPEREGGPDVFARVRVRVDADFGVGDGELAYSPTSRGFVPALQRAPVDVMYAYVEGRRLGGGWLGFRAGRQYRVDSLGMWSFDGAMVRASSERAHVQVESFGGFEQRGGLPLSTSRWERGGIWRADRAGYEGWAYPELGQAALAPAWGASVETLALPVVHARLDYRKVWNRGDSVVTLLPDPVTGQLATTTGTRVSSERAGASVVATVPRAFALQTGAVYDLWDASIASAWASADAFATRALTIGADLDFYRPVFDADSIFNFFSRGPTRTAAGRVAWAPSSRFDAAISAGAKAFSSDGDAAAGGGDAIDAIGSASARLRLSRGVVGARGGWDAGSRGRREGGDLFGERWFLGGRWSALARTSIWDWHDAERSDRDATSFGYVLGGAFRPRPGTRVALEWEHETNRVVGQRYRVLAMLDVWVGP